MSKVKRWWINVKWLLYSCHGIHQIIRAVEIWMVLVVRGASALRRPISMPSSTGTPNQFIQDDNILSISITYGLLIFEFYCSSQDRGLFIQDFVLSLMSLYGLQQTHEWRMIMTPDHLGVVTPLTKVERIWNDNE